MSDQGASSSTLPPCSLRSDENVFPVEDVSSLRYYCHSCDSEFTGLNRGASDELLCSTCLSGFVELIEATPSTSPSSSSSAASNSGGGRPVEIFGDYLFRELQTLQQNLGLTFTSPPFSPRDSMSPQSDASNNSLPTQPGGGEDNARGGRDGIRGINLRNSSGQSLENFFSDLLFRMGGTDVTNSPFFLVGNPGDYAWGREGLDAIVTQLLNQMDGSGPPPLSTDKIKEIPITKVTQEQADAHLQCSVCWETFQVDEFVRKLACDHLYHTPCIEPWLQLHGTCPICRKTLHTESNLGGLNPSDALNMASLASAFLGGARPVSNSNPSGGGSNNQNNGNGSSSSSSASERRFFDMDFD